MRITDIRTTPLRLAYGQPMYWAHGQIEWADLVLVEVHTDEGLVGYGECTSTSPASALQSFIAHAAQHCVGRSPFEVTAIGRKIYQQVFAIRGNVSVPRFFAQVIAGIDMALWDIIGKATGRALHELLGGAVRDHIGYYAFPQGDTPEATAVEARRASDAGFDIIYLKVGRGDAFDLEMVERVRAEIGNKRLRIDANEAWDALKASRMLRRLEHYDIEFVEQPTRGTSISALAQVRAGSSIAIAADQTTHSLEDVYEVCRRQAADLVVLGIHESAGITRYCKAAAIAEAAGLNVCLHGVFESGITTCVQHQIGASLVNLDDGNQYMHHFPLEDIVASPNLTVTEGRLDLLEGRPGLGFDLNWDAIGKAHERYLASAD